MRAGFIVFCTLIREISPESFINDENEKNDRSDTEFLLSGTRSRRLIKESANKWRCNEAGEILCITDDTHSQYLMPAGSCIARTRDGLRGIVLSRPSSSSVLNYVRLICFDSRKTRFHSGVL